MSCLPLKFGFAPSRWTKAIQIMLEKTGHLLVSKLRDIIILETDYNWILQIIWGERLFHHTAQSQVLMSVQQTRPGYQSNNSCFKKVLTYDLFGPT